VSRGTRTGLSVRFLVHSGSPRAFCPRDDKIELVEDTVRLLVHSGSPRAFCPRDDKSEDALAMTRCVKRYSRMRTYAGAPRAWHGPFGLPPL
jgi:hypothetical protein